MRVRLTPLFVALSLALAAGAARAELAAWDQAKVTGIAKQLVTASQELYDTFYKQPVPMGTQQRAYQRLKQKIRGIRTQAQQLAGDLDKGENQEATEPEYQDIMELVRAARDDAPKIFASKDVAEK